MNKGFERNLRLLPREQTATYCTGGYSQYLTTYTVVFACRRRIQLFGSASGRRTGSAVDMPVTREPAANLEDQFAKLIRSAMRFAMPVAQEVMAQGAVSSACISSLLVLYKGLARYEIWALKCESQHRQHLFQGVEKF
ncbi:uncharacterized protein LOC119391131 [Rhipicephalus sanguineus]|uniref:uncharacterized protein LOC119391131 n=1 Tax=Rhipicephalus sanguineus TaxID=34632 RepID=UPI001895E6D7|nr:uncharacterized protein LOC119391131 [Rhipicephalus sanguineus]XP_037514742.1 uncharacterized protein LOC119391131 [Rhipicephalus sanguineus]